MAPTLHEIPLGSGQPITGGKYHDDDPIEEYNPDDLVIERDSPVTLSAKAKSDVVTELYRILDRLEILQVAVSNVLISVDRGG